jgi:hypothetical protein
MVPWVLELRRLPPAPYLDRVVLGLAVGNVFVRRVRNRFECRVALRFGRGELLLGLA